MTEFWQTLPRPIYALAPMEDVTDTVFRRIVASCGRPTVMFTEFLHADMVTAPRKYPGPTPRLVHTSFEQPLVAQIWGNRPEDYARASVGLRELGFCGVDINMGCPVRKLRRKGACSGLILNPGLAAELIDAAAEGGLPVSVKTRIGYDRPQTEAWIGFLLEQRLAALTVHGRFAEQDKHDPADWEQIRIASDLRRSIAPDTVLLGNGDVSSLDDADARVAEYSLDGVMIGRGIFADPYLFGRRDRDLPPFEQESAVNKLDLLLRHVRLYRQTWSGRRNYEILKKFYKIYLADFPGAEDIRDRLNHTATYDQAIATVRAWRDERGNP